MDGHLIGVDLASILQLMDGSRVMAVSGACIRRCIDRRRK
jgi:hypothetical protein